MVDAPSVGVADVVVGLALSVVGEAVVSPALGESSAPELSLLPPHPATSIARTMGTVMRADLMCSPRWRDGSQ